MSFLPGSAYGLGKPVFEIEQGSSSLHLYLFLFASLIGIGIYPKSFSCGFAEVGTEEG